MKLEKRITFGFKIMSGWYNGAVSKDDVSALSDNKNIPWGSLELENLMNRMGKALQKNEVLKYWQGWDVTILDLMGDQVALNYLLVMAKDWNRKGEPVATNAAKHMQFQKNAVTLLDRSVYEYVSRQWRGSGDSKISMNVKDLGSDVFPAIAKDKWERLTSEVINEGKVEDRSYLSDDPDKKVDNAVKVLLIYYYILKKIDPPAAAERPWEVDHIIPKTRFKAIANPEIRRKCNHIANLSLLPKTPNTLKTNRALNELVDPVVKKQVSKYTEIKEPDFAKYSKPEQIDDLIAIRGMELGRVLTTVRADTLGG